ncbi:MAG: hypothetical protein J5825_05960 [Lachnospiraceae bacterium]|nr:hypothetical protein [Lachnospiraceae bacterium]
MKKKNLFVRALCVVTLMTILATGCTKEPDGGKTEPEKTEPASKTETTEPASATESQTEEASNLPAKDESAVQVTIDPSVTYQTWEGFGSGFTWYADWMTENANAEKAYDAFFSDLKLTNLRFRNTYQYGSKESVGFKTEKAIYDAAVKRAKENGEEITVLLSSWSPSADLKSTGKIEGDSTIAKNADGTYMYKEFGEYMANAVEAYEAAGVPIDVLSIQNEPDYLAEDYDCCLLNYKEDENTACYADAYLATYKAMKDKFGEDAPHMIGPECFSMESSNRLKLYMNPILEQEPDSVWGICHHLYGGGDDENPISYIQNMWNLKSAFPDTRKWMTEYYTETGLQMAFLIQESIVEERASSYFYWDGVWDTMGGMICFEWNRKSDFVIKEKYYAYKQFSHFIQPGDVNIDAKAKGDSNVRAVSFLSEDGTKVTTVVINGGENERKVQLWLGDQSMSGTTMMCSDFQDSYDTLDLSGILCQDAGTLDESQIFTCPAGSVTTFVTEVK